MKSAGFIVRNAENEKPDNTESLEKKNAKREKDKEELRSRKKHSLASLTK